jgi:hypothetical protein
MACLDRRPKGLNSLTTGGTEGHGVELVAVLSGTFLADRTMALHGLFSGCLALTGRDKVLPTQGLGAGLAGPQSPDLKGVTDDHPP